MEDAGDVEVAITDADLHALPTKFPSLNIPIHTISILLSVIPYRSLLFNGGLDANALSSHFLDFGIFCIADYTSFLLLNSSWSRGKQFYWSCGSIRHVFTSYSKSCGCSIITRSAWFLLQRFILQLLLQTDMNRLWIWYHHWSGSTLRLWHVGCRGAVGQIPE